MKRGLLCLALLASAGCIDLEGAEQELCLREGNEGLCPSSPMAYGLQLFGTPEQCGELSVAVTTSEGGVPATRTSLRWARCPSEDSPPGECVDLGEGPRLLIPGDVVGVLRAELVAEYEGRTRTFRAFSAPVAPQRHGAALDVEWLTGFESGTLAGSGLGTGSNAQVVAVGGGAALQLNATGGGAHTVRPYLEQVPGRLVVRATLTVTSVSGAADLISVQTANGVAASFGIDPQGKFRVKLPASAPAGEVTVTPGTTYQVDVIFDFNGGHSVEAQVDGVPLSAARDPAAADDLVQLMTLGMPSVGTYQVLFDDVVTSLTSPDPLGAGYVIALRPDSAGGHANPELFSTATADLAVRTPLPASDTSSWTLVVEALMSNLGGAILQEQTHLGAYVQHGFQDTFLTPPDAVSLTFAVGSTNPTNNTWSRGYASLGGAVEEIYQSGMSIPSLWRAHSRAFPPPGISSREWSLCHLNQLQSRWGYSEDVSGSLPALHTLLVEAFIAGARP